KKAETKIKQSLREKDALLREIHHRVKNNLQIISSLLKLQAGRVNDEYVKKVYQESNNRITAMALVHEILYQSEDLAEIDLNEYIIHIVKNILKVFGTPAKHIDFKTEGDMINLGINQAVPIGLVLNEIISNSLKHAFKEAEKGEIRICSRLLENNEIELIISDNGRGIPDHIDYRNTKTLGLKLITGLIEKQIKGALDLSRNAGTRYAIRFKRKD
ncbi:MAG: sensor histidine kinase, partial [bacterium]